MFAVFTHTHTQTSYFVHFIQLNFRIKYTNQWYYHFTHSGQFNELQNRTPNCIRFYHRNNTIYYHASIRHASTLLLYFEQFQMKIKSNCPFFECYRHIFIWIYNQFYIAYTHVYNYRMSFGFYENKHI